MQPNLNSKIIRLTLASFDSETPGVREKNHVEVLVLYGNEIITRDLNIRNTGVLISP
jgi:hypothetical protein